MSAVERPGGGSSGADPEGSSGGDDATGANAQVSGLSELASVPLSTLSSAVLSAQAAQQASVDLLYYRSASSFLSLHSEVQSSLALLDSLSSFLSSFQADLSSDSGHISDLQERSHALDARLAGRRKLDAQLSKLIAQVALSPRLVDLFFDSEPRQGGWLEACEDLERVLDATQSVAGLQPPPVSGAGTGSGGISAPGTPTGAAAVSATGDSSLSSSGASSDPETRILLESRALAQSCLAAAVRKLRPYLLGSFSVFKSSISTNLQVLQTSVLLKPAHRGLYAFLARQAPRAAIDVQRAYLAAARLYFETGFRRYTRALERVRARSVGYAEPLGAGAGAATGAGESSSGSGAQASASSDTETPPDTLIGDSAPASMSGAALALLSRAGGGGGASSAEADQLDKADTLFVLDERRIAHSLFDGPGVVLAYMAENPSFKAPSEALFRSLALTFLDNACSEYAFLVRYFESLPAPRHRPPPAGGRPGAGSHARRDSAAPSSSSAAGSARPSIDGGRPAGGSFSAVEPASAPATAAADESIVSAGSALSFSTVGPAPSESASAYGGGGGGGAARRPSAPRSAASSARAFSFDAVAAAEGTPADDFGRTIVRLTLKEQRARKGKGVEDELWRQVMEPVLGHWNTFTKALLTSSPPPPLLSLLCMVKLNESLMAAATARGASSVLQGPLLAFKIAAWPLIQRSFGEHTASVRRLMTKYGLSTAGRPALPSDSAGGAAGAVGSAAESVVAGLTSWSGLTGLVNAAAAATGNFSAAEKQATVRLVCTRYARLVLAAVQLCDEQNETMLFGSLQRLRDEIEHLAKEAAKAVGKELAKKGGPQAKSDKQLLAAFCDAVTKVLATELPAAQTGRERVSASHPRIQSELSHWTELRIAALR